MKRIALVFLLAAGFMRPALLMPVAAAQQTTAASRTRTAVEFLASDRLEGRDTGSPGERLAGDYIAMQLARVGAKPLPGHRDLFMPFEFTAGTRDGGSNLTMRAGGGASKAFRGTEQIQALSFSDDATVNGPVVFAGYGLVVPESAGLGYDSYAGIDVKDKIALVLHYFPEDADAKTKAALARYSDLRYKALNARQRGAKGLLIVTGPRSPNAGQTIRVTSDTALSGSGIPAATDQRRGGQRVVRRRAEDTCRGTAGARLRQSACRRLRVARPGRCHDESRPREANRAQRRRVSAGRERDG
jgi:hypothetical protein